MSDGRVSQLLLSREMPTYMALMSIAPLQSRQMERYTVISPNGLHLDASCLGPVTRDSTISVKCWETMNEQSSVLCILL